MRIEENSFTRLKWTGHFGPIIGDRVEVAGYQIELLGPSVYLALQSKDLHASLVARDLPRLLNFYRDLGDALNELQPGLTMPLPDGDPDYVEALKVVHEADRLRAEGK